MSKPGPLNTICDVPGIRVGNAEDQNLATGTTVIMPDTAATCVVDHRGGGIGSRDTVVLAAGSTISKANAVVLSGGSAYGLDAAGGVMHWLRQAGKGFPVGAEIVPIVPQAIIFDLLFRQSGDWDHPPWWALGLQACQAASTTVKLGNVGAGLGATAGTLKGGLGSASIVAPDGVVGALAVANPAGSVTIPGTDTFWTWMLEQDGEMGQQVPPATRPKFFSASGGSALANTTLAVVATDLALTRDQAQRVAIMAQDGIAHAIRPAHGPLDGDTVFVMSTERRVSDMTPAAIARLGTLAADCVARAIVRGVYEAETLGGFKSYRDSRNG